MYRMLLKLVFFLGCQLIGSHWAGALTWPLPSAVTRIDNLGQWEALSVWDEASQTRELKYLVILDGPEQQPQGILLLDSHKYPLHLDFFADRQNQEAFAALGLGQPSYIADALQVGKRLVLSGSLFWKPSIGYYHEMYVRSYASIAQVVADAEWHQTWLRQAIPDLPATLAFHPSGQTFSRFATEWSDFGYRIVTDDELETRLQIGYVTKTAYGILKAYSKDALTAAIHQGVDFRRQILILDHLPFELPVAAGVITTVPQSALSHVFVKARQRGIPSAYARPESLAVEPHLDTAVKLVVTRSRVAISSIQDPGLIDTYLQSLQLKRDVTLAAIDLGARPAALVRLDSRLQIKSQGLLDQVGAKAANDAWLASYFATSNQSEAGDPVVLKHRQGFAISQYFYRAFLAQNGMEARIAAALAAIKAEPHRQQAQLAGIRNMIRYQGQVADDFLTELNGQLVAAYGQKPAATRLRFRSSSNAEDLESFSGAGLYESEWGCLADFAAPVGTSQSLCVGKASKKHRPLAAILRRVWASVFTDRAYAEREFYGIDHNQVNMGILVNEAFADEDLNGVVISRDVEGWRNFGPGLTIHVQRGETSVVRPEDGSIPEKIVAVAGLPPISTPSSLSPQQALLSPTEVAMLETKISDLAGSFIGGHYDVGIYAADLEFKGYRNLATGQLEVFVKQVRPYRFAEPTKIAAAAIPLPRRDFFPEIDWLQIDTFARAHGGAYDRWPIALEAYQLTDLSAAGRQAALDAIVKARNLGAYESPLAANADQFDLGTIFDQTLRYEVFVFPYNLRSPLRTAGVTDREVQNQIIATIFGTVDRLPPPAAVASLTALSREPGPHQQLYVDLRQHIQEAFPESTKLISNDVFWTSLLNSDESVPWVTEPGYQMLAGLAPRIKAALAVDVLTVNAYLSPVRRLIEIGTVSGTYENLFYSHECSSAYFCRLVWIETFVIMTYDKVIVLEVHQANA